MAVQGIGQLTGADEGFNHQIVDTFATVAESDRSWTEKAWASLARRDGSLQVDFGLGQYHNRNVVDAFAGISRGREQWIVRASRSIDGRRDTSVGPVRYEVIEPLNVIRMALDDNDACDIAFDLTFTGVLPPFFEDRNSYRDLAGRISANVIRYHQAGEVEGWVRVGADRHTVTRDEWFGFRDHSWGVRGEGAVGAPPADIAPNPIEVLSGDSDLPCAMHWTPWCLRRPDGTRYEIQFLVMEIAGFRAIDSAYVNYADGQQIRARTLARRRAGRQRDRRRGRHRRCATDRRLTIGYVRGSGPARLVVKLASDDPERRTKDAFTYRCEVNFYRQIAPRVSVRIPRCYLAAANDDGTVFTLLLEDLAPAVAGDQIAGCSVQQAYDAAVNVAGLHGPLWRDQGLRALDWLIPMSPDIADLSAAFFKDATATFLERYTLSDETAAALAEFGDKSETFWRQDPETFSLLHADYRLDNLLFEPSDSPDPVIAVDWQACMVGQPLRDVAFVVVSGLSPEDRRASERDIVAAYHHELRSFGVGDYSLEQCWQDYRFGVLHSAMITVFGAAAGIPSERGDRMFTVMAERSAAAINDLDVLAML